MVRLGSLFPVLALAGCAGSKRPVPEDVRPHMFLSGLSTVFRNCAPGHVVRASLTDYQVTACNMVATYHCPNMTLRDDPVCRLEAVDPLPPASEPPPPQAESRQSPPAAQAASQKLPPTHASRRPAPTEADRLFEEGRMLAKLYRFREACRLFVESDAIARTFGTAVNLGDCALRAGRLGDAWWFYDDAVRAAERDGRADLANFAGDRAAAIEPRLCTIVVRIADPTVAGLSLRIGDRVIAPASSVRVLVDPGDVTVVVSMHGTPTFRRTVRCLAGQRKVVEVPR